MGKSFARFAMGEVKRAARKHGYEKDIVKQRREMERTFAKAKECIRKREMQVNRWVEDGQEAYELVEYIRSGGEPY